MVFLKKLKIFSKSTGIRGHGHHYVYILFFFFQIKNEKNIINLARECRKKEYLKTFRKFFKEFIT